MFRCLRRGDTDAVKGAGPAGCVLEMEDGLFVLLRTSKHPRVFSSTVSIAGRGSREIHEHVVAAMVQGQRGLDDGRVEALGGCMGAAETSKQRVIHD